MGQSSGRSVIFRAQRGKSSGDAYISRMRSSDQVSGTDPMFVAWRSIEGACKPNID